MALVQVEALVRDGPNCTRGASLVFIVPVLILGRISAFFQQNARLCGECRRDDVRESL